LPRAVRVAVAERFGVLALEGFGLSETGMVALHARPGDARPESVGVPVEGVEARLVDPEGAVIEGAGTGELQVRGRGLMREYLHDPDATAAALQDGWYRTGNIARRAEDGHYVMVDRPTHLIMRGGLAFYRRAVEEALLTHPAISSAKVVGVPHPRHGEELRTVIERDPAAVVSEAELVEWARQQLPGLTDSQIEVSAVPAAGRRELIRAGARRLLPGVGVTVAGTAAAFLVNLGVAAVMLIRAHRNRNRPPPGFGSGFGGWGMRG
jgi:long-chain acyl-CoA synthetase